MIDAVQTWIGDHRAITIVMVSASVVMFFGSLIALPWILASLPTDYFTEDNHSVPVWGEEHPVLRWVVRIVKSLVGAVLIVAGIAMLALPGQGLLSILVGLMLLEFPGKRHLIVWFGQRRSIRRGLNWARRKMGKPEFVHAERRVRRRLG